MSIRVVEVGKKPWRSMGSDAEIRAENDATGLTTRDQQRQVARFSLRRELLLKRRAFHSLVNRDAADDAATFWRGREFEPEAWVRRREVHAGVQAVPAAVVAATQTPYFRKVHAAVQAVPHLVDARAVPGTAGDVDDPGQAAATAAAADPRLAKFIKRSIPRMLHHLEQAAAVPIFGDDYVALADDDAFASAREEGHLREAGTFFHLHTRDRRIASIDWRPGGRPIVAVAAASAAGIVERWDASRAVEGCAAVVWNFAEQANPQFVLDAPAEVLTLKFCPTKPHLVVGGLVNGQVLLWDLSVAPDTKMRYGKGASHAKVQRAAPAGQAEDVTAVPAMPPQSKGHWLERSGDHLVSRLLPVQVSRVEHGHRRGVHDICWLPEQLMCDHEGRLIPAEEQWQFGTVGDDGVLCIWDLRPDNLPESKARRLKYGRVAPGDERPWVPLLRYGLSRPDGTGEAAAFRFHLEGRMAGGRPSYRMMLATLDGELCECNWGPRESGAAKDHKVIRSAVTAHAGPVFSVQRHPLLPDIYLTVGDWGFKVWKVGVQVPLLASPPSEQPVMCGKWSPTRAAVLFIGTRDGWVQVWDLLDRSHERLFATQVIPEAITSLEFRPASERQRQQQAAGTLGGGPGGGGSTQSLAVGTRRGEFRLYELPRVLTRSHGGETRAARHFLEREARRVKYFAWRWQERQSELDRRRAEDDGAGAKRDGADDLEGDNAEYNVTAEDIREFSELVAQLNPRDETESEEEAEESEAEA